MKVLKILLINTVLWTLPCHSQQLAMKSHMMAMSDGLNLRSKSNTKSGSTKTIEQKPIETVSFAPADVNINYLPLYGNYVKTKQQLLDDQLFLRDCDQSFGNRELGSTFFTQMGWTYLSDGDKNNAIHRFNLAYLLNQNNFEIYWGLGVIEYQAKKFKEAEGLMNKGLDLNPNNYILMVDLATVYLQIGDDNSSSISEIAKARNLLEKAIVIQPEYEMAYMQLTLVNLLENKNKEAWECFHKGDDLNPNEANQEILKELLKRMPDPLGKFK